MGALALAGCGDDDTKNQDATTTTDSLTTDTVTAETTTTDTVATETTTTDTVDETIADTTPTDTAEVVDPSYGLALVDKQPPVDITPDGATVLIWDATSLGDAYLYDVATKALTLETSVGGSPRDFPTALSANLRITANYGEPIQAGLWTGDAWRQLGSLFAEGCGTTVEDPKAGDIGSAWDVSADGEIVVGLLWNGCTTVAFRWSQAGETRDFRALQLLGDKPEGATLDPINRATVISDDGTTAAGFAQTKLVDRWPAIWKTDDATGFLLETDVFTNDSPGEILAIETDGTVAVGVWNQQGFIWNATDGVVNIGALPEVLPGEPTYANAVAANGTLVFGVSGGGFFGIQNAFVWTKDKGMRKLADLAAANGITLPAETRMTNVLGASTDGAVVIGTTEDATFATKTFVLRLPASAYTAD